MKRIMTLFLVIIVIFVLSLTNPDRTQYIDWMNNKTMEQSSNLLTKGIFSIAGKSIFNAGTKKSDYYIFSIYETDFTDDGFGKVTSLGILNHFIQLNSTDAKN